MDKLFSINMDVDTPVLEPDSYNFEFAKPAFVKFIPRFLSILNKYNIKATFFIVAKFARDKSIAKVIKELSDNEHEIGNHSFSHHKHFALFPFRDIYKEIKEADKILSDITGKKIYGFRSPGYTISPNLLRALHELNYLYDASLNTSIFYYLLKLISIKVFRVNPRFIKLQPFSYHFFPSRPFNIDCDRMCVAEKGVNVCEIPMPTIPIISYPFVGTLINRSSILTRFLYCLLMNRRYLHLQLHDIEFAKDCDVEMIKNIYTANAAKDLNKRIVLYDRLIRMVSKNYKFKTLKEIAFHFNGSR